MRTHVIDSGSISSFVSITYCSPPPSNSHTPLSFSLSLSLPLSFSFSPQEQRVESAAYVWELIQNCLDMLEISEEEAHGLWSLLAAIYHLGNANVKKSKPNVTHMYMYVYMYYACFHM